MRKLFKRTRKAIMRHLIHFFLLIAAICATGSIYTSCSEENDCSMTGRPMMNCSFYTIVPDTRTVRRDTLDSLTITAYGTDSVILNNEKDVYSLLLPLRYTNDTTIFVFHYNPAGQPNHVDTLYVIQENTPYFQSMECGYMMEQDILSVHTGRPGSNSQPDRIDSLNLRNQEANANGIENLQIFYRYRDRTPAID